MEVDIMNSVWEYKFLSFGLGGISRDNIEIMLNELGEQGWELVGVTEDDGHHTQVFLKRQK